MRTHRRFELEDQNSQAANRKEVLNDGHRRRLRVTFQHVDSILREVEHIFADQQSKSPLSPYSSDLDSIKRLKIHDGIVRVRARMAEIMKEYAIPFARARCGERWAAQTALLGASISIEELTADRLGGYGDVSAEGADLLKKIRDDLGSALEDLRSYLEPP
jgi:hypothetical protein